MGLFFFALRGSLALLLLCSAIFGEKNPLPDNRRGLGRPWQPIAGEDAIQQTEGIMDQSPRHKMTRPSRRFSRPHALINPTKSPTVKQSVGKVLEIEPLLMLPVANDIEVSFDSVERSEPNQKAEGVKACEAGGSEDSTPAEVSQLIIPPHQESVKHRNDSYNSEHVDDFPDKSRVNKTRRLKHKVRKSSSSVATTLPNRLNYILNSLYTLRHHNGTLCNSLCNITGTTYVEYIRPYMTHLHNLASDAYDAQLEQQNVVKVKGKINIVPRSKDPINRKDKKWSMPKLPFRKKPSSIGRSASNVNGSVAAGTDDDMTRKLTNLDTHKVKARQALLERNITFLNNIVASKDATVRELVQRLSSLEQELSILRQATSVASSPPAAPSEATVEETEPAATLAVPNAMAVKSEGSISNDDTFSVRQDGSEMAEPREVHTAADTVPGVDAAAGSIASTIDRHDLLQHVLNALYIVSTSADTATNNDIAESSEAVAVLLSSDQQSIVESASVSVLPVSSDSAPIVYPSIVNSVIAERKVQEEYMQRLCDAAAAMAVVLPSCVETPTISARIEEGADIVPNEVTSDNTAQIPTSTIAPDSYTTSNPLQSVVESLERQLAVLNDELVNISAQLCHYRGQHFAPLDSMEDDMNGESTSKHGWFW